MNVLQDITAALAPHGLNLVGTATVTAYEALVPAQYSVASLMPQATTVLVLGNGGGEFWQRFRTYGEARPGYLAQREHPLDDYTLEIIESSLTPILEHAGAASRYLYPFRFWTEPVSFMHLAQAAGLAGPSILGVMIHPTYGPWIALRAAVLLDLVLSAPSIAAGFDPCPTCTERPCITACPAQAISQEKGWNIPVCVTHRLQVTVDCVDYCRARYDCVYGREHRYPLDELQYHQQHSFAEMRKYFRERSAISFQQSAKPTTL